MWPGWQLRTEGRPLGSGCSKGLLETATDPQLKKHWKFFCDSQAVLLLGRAELGHCYNPSFLDRQRLESLESVCGANVSFFVLCFLPFFSVACFLMLYSSLATKQA